MFKHQKICFKVPIKNQKQIEEYKRRQKNPIQGTPKITMGKFQQGCQQIWTQPFKSIKNNQLKSLKPISHAFQAAIIISNAVKQLSKIYGNFIINENMIFNTESQQIFVWINPDIFSNNPKIYLPKSKQGQLEMIKGLLNNLKSWLVTNYKMLSQIQLIEQIPYKLEQLSKQKPFILNKKNSIAVFQRQNHSQKMGKRLYQSTKGIKLKNQKDYEQNFQNQLNIKKEKCLTNRCYTNKSNQNQKKIKKQDQCFSNKNQFSKHSGSIQDKQLTSSFSKETSLSFKSISKKQKQRNFPNKTTSSTLKILQQIKKADQNPNFYCSNKIIQYKSHETSIKQQKCNVPLGGIGEQLDNLFLSNIQSQQQNIEEVQKREQEFQKLLQF